MSTDSRDVSGWGVSMISQKASNYGVFPRQLGYVADVFVDWFRWKVHRVGEPGIMSREGQAERNRWARRCGGLQGYLPVSIFTELKQLRMDRSLLKQTTVTLTITAEGCSVYSGWIGNRAAAGRLVVTVSHDPNVSFAERGEPSGSG